MAYTFDEQILSDIHKDARGFRPGEGFWRHWNESTMDEKQSIWDGLIRESDDEMERERAAQAVAVAEFEKLVQRNLQLGARTRGDAVRWIVESLGFDEIDFRYGGSRVCYELGLPYSMETEFNGICADLAGRIEREAA